MKNLTFWLLFRATCEVDGRILVTFLGVEGSSAHKCESPKATIHAINVQGGRDQTSENSESLKNFEYRWQGALATILDILYGSHLELF